MELTSCKLRSGNIQPRIAIPQPPGDCNCGLLVQQMKAGLQLLESNLTQTKQIMTMEKAQIAKERDDLMLQAINLRREKSTLEKELELFKQASKDQFASLLSSVSTVSRSLLEKIDSVFPRHIAFQLTCPKQREHLEQIQSNCTSLSREVENKLQGYMNMVGDKVSSLEIEANHLKAENWRLSDDYRWCSQNRTKMMEEHKRSREELQQKHDREKERLLMDKMKLSGEGDVLRNDVKYKEAAMDLLKEQLNHLNMSCMAKNGFGGHSGVGFGPRTGTQNQFGLPGFGGSSSSSSSSSSAGQARTGTAGSGSSFSSGSGFNRAASTGGLGSYSPTLQQSGSSSGSGFNKAASTGAGSSSFPLPGSAGAGSFSPTLQQSGSSSSLGVNKPASTGGLSTALGSLGLSPGSSGTGSTKPADSGRSSSSSFGFGLNQGSSGTNLNKPTSTGRSSPGLGSSASSGSSGSPSKTSSSVLDWFGQGATSTGRSSPGLGSSASSGSSGSPSKTSSSVLDWFGQGSTNSGQSRTGSVPGRSSLGGGTGGTGTGSVFGGGRTNGPAGSSAIAQHLQELHRLVNPQAPQEKQDLSRMLG